MSDITLDWSFGGQIRRYRLRQRIVLREMSRKLNMDSGNYCKIEQNKLPPPNKVEKIEAITRYLKLSSVEKEILFASAYNFHIGSLHRKFWNAHD